MSDGEIDPRILGGKESFLEYLAELADKPELSDRRPSSDIVNDALIARFSSRVDEKAAGIHDPEVLLAEEEILAQPKDVAMDGLVTRFMTSRTERISQSKKSLNRP